MTPRGAIAGGFWHGVAIAASLALFAAIPAVIQFGFLPVAEDADTDFHIAVGRLIAEHGILEAFPWTPFSILAEHYADKELLLHLLFVPLSSVEAATAANIVGTILGGILLSALGLVLWRERVRYPAAWAVVPLLASSAFVYRFALVRPHLLSIPLAVLALWAASRERLLLLAAVSALYPWAYVAWQMPIALAIVAEVARVTSGAHPGWRTPLVAVGGVVAGIALHPNALDLVRFNWIVLHDVLVQNAWGGRAGITLGDEFRPFRVEEWARLLVPPAAMALVAAMLAWRRRRESSTPLAFAMATFAFGLLTIRTARFTEYFVPFAVLTVALTAGKLRPRLSIALALVLCTGYSAGETWRLLHRLGETPARLTSEEVTVLRSRIPPGSQVFTCNWGVTGTLMLALPDRRFMVALDPTLFQVNDPRRYALWYRIPREPPPGAAQVIREEFGADFIACLWDDKYRRFFNQVAFEPGVNTLLMTDFWNFYDLRSR